MRNIRRVGGQDVDPLEGVANFFDLGIVFALAFMVALIAYLGLPELMQRKDLTLIKNPGTEQMEIIHKKGEKLEHYKVSRQSMGGQGEKLGTAYRLKSGEVIYVPEGDE